MKNAKKKTSKRKEDPAKKENEITLDLPDVKDIPGQEHIHVPPLGELADTTISSADEEGDNLFAEDNDEIKQKNTTNVSKAEKKALKEAAEKMPDVKDEKNLKDAQLDRRDEDGELLNEKTDLSGSDLDVPGSEEDDSDEKIGEEDEENNSYSIDSEDEDNSISKQ